jgi:hypothetical protein
MKAAAVAILPKFLVARGDCLKARNDTVPTPLVETFQPFINLAFPKWGHHLCTHTLTVVASSPLITAAARDVYMQVANCVLSAQKNQ